MYYIAANFHTHVPVVPLVSHTSYSMQRNENIFTVSRLNAEVRLLLENEMGIVWLVGELSNFSAPVSGHWYFSLKDSRAQVKCAMFRGNNRRVTFKPANGNQVLVKARLSLYEPRGDYQLIVESMQPEGDGKLQQQFDALKMQLAAEGLFAQSAKKNLPENPTTVGVVTSKTGAALYDILDVLKRRDPSLPVIVYPTMVQGDSAAIEIAQAIGRANARNECDVLIVGRGGGSLEDLWCFNNEIVARTIAASSIPVISAVGHEIDVTIADFVSDVRAPTPSAAAELVSRDQSSKVQALLNMKSRLQSSVKAYLSEHQLQMRQLSHQLDRQHPNYRLQRQSQQLDDLESRLIKHMQSMQSESQLNLQQLSHRLQLHSPDQLIQGQQHHIARLQQKMLDAMDKKLLTERHKLALAAETLDAVSPLATLKRGYSITRTDKGEIVKRADQVTKGDRLITQLDSGTLHSTVD